MVGGGGSSSDTRAISVESGQILAKYIEGDRALALCQAVDGAYLSFVDQLPARLRDFALKKASFDNRSGAVPFASLSQLNAIICGAPWLFWEACRELADEQLQPIAEAGAFLGLAYVLLDHLVDGQTADPAVATLLQNAFHERALLRLQGLFSAQNPFWDDYDRLSAKLRNSFAWELVTQADPGQMSLETFRQTAEGKVAPAIITMAAVAHISRDPQLLLASEAALIDAICAGQLGHDVSDWRNDLASGHFTYFLSLCISFEDCTVEAWPSEDEIERRIADRWLDVESNKTARHWFKSAWNHGEPLGCAGWNNYIEHYLNAIQENITRAIGLHLLQALA